MVGALGDAGSLQLLSDQEPRGAGRCGRRRGAHTRARGARPSFARLRSGSRRRYVRPAASTRGLTRCQAAILRVLLPHLTTANAQRRVYAQRYDEAFAPLVVTTGRLKLPVFRLWCGLSPVCGRGRRTGPHPGCPAGGMESAPRSSIRPACIGPPVDRRCGEPNCPVTDRLADTLLSLPIQPELMAEQPRIIGALSMAISSAQFDEGCRWRAHRERSSYMRLARRW